MKRKKKGFKIELCGELFTVYFKIIHNWKVICVIDTDGEGSFKGVAKCNLEYDEFNESDGKVLAYERAFEKFQKKVTQTKLEQIKRREKENSIILKGIDNRFNKMIRKGEL